MREIIFRGKRVDNGMWVFGFYIENELFDGGLEPSIIPVDEKGAALYDDDGYNIEIKVNPKTIGQYTGLTDKNGTRIFEGDIVRTKKYGRIIELKDHTYTNVSDYDTFVVCYSPCMFRLLREKPDRGFNLVNDGYAQLEVIGNIHDNPELLEG